MANSSKSFGKLTIPLLVLLAISFWALPAQAKYGGGTGEPNGPYLIYDANQMNAIGADSNDWDKHFKLMADIDLSAYTGTEFNIIGTYWHNPFTGVFDGNDRTISNFTYISTGTNYIGLFRHVDDPNAEIKNLGLIDPNLDAGTRDYVGSLVGYLSRGTITNCYAEGGSVAGRSVVGGLVGRNHYATITNCYSTGSVTGYQSVGGLVGQNHDTIINCYAVADVSGDRFVGGLVGYNYRATITNCYSTGSVAGSLDVGGLVGWNYGTITNCYSEGDVSGDRFVGGLVGDNDDTIANSYSTGSVSGYENVGGLVGSGAKRRVADSFWDIQTSGQATSAGGTGKTTAEMQMVSTFLVWACSGDSVWTIDEGNDYPRLWWENMPGEPITSPFYGVGNGTEADPHLIYAADQLNAIGLFTCLWDKHFKLMADIDLSGYTGTSFNIIGEYYYDAGWVTNPFTGVFDGNGHTISNFSYTSTGTSNTGLFGYVNDPNAEIKNLGLIDPNVDAGAGDYVGSLVDLLRGGTISNCYVQGGSVSGGSRVGGLVGTNGGTITNSYATGSIVGETYYIGGLVGDNVGTITNCYSEGDVSGARYVGGLVGQNDATISDCYSSGDVSGDYYVGGLVGFNRSTISDCYSEGDVSGYYSVGGLVGQNGFWYMGCNPGTISNCYSTGSVSGNNLVGGLLGYNQCGEITGSFWDIETSGQPTSAGGTGLTTTEMQIMSTFITWGCDPVWTIDEGVDYPRLIWENKPGELITKPSYGGGSGEPNDPYLIYTAEQVNTIGLIRCDWDKHFLLCADIDLSVYTGTSFNMIGIYVGHNDPGNRPFAGVFDGNGHTISNFSYTSTDTSSIGLFGIVDDPNAEIKNLGLINPDVDAGTGSRVGSLVGHLENGTITGCYVQGGSVSGNFNVGGLVGQNHDTITNCYSEGDVSGDFHVGGLVGSNRATITNCYSTGSVAGSDVGGLVGFSHGTITNSYSTASVSGASDSIGGLVGYNLWGTITNCYSTGSVSGYENVGGLVGENYRGTISNCYSTGSVSGNRLIGGLVGENYRGTISNCYSTASVSGNNDVGGLAGSNEAGEVIGSFWDIQTSGQDWSDGGTGLATSEMQMAITFIDAGWDFNTPVWTIDEGVDYPRLWWELAPVLHAEPEVTLGTTNTISWDPVPGANDYYAECAEDANFTSILYSTGWIEETSCEFTGLELGRRYWYSVKARNSVGTETGWSNVESSLQGTLADAVDMMLDPESLRNENLKNALLNKINAAQQMIADGLYEEALDKLQNDILQKTNGCADTGEPDKNDWIITCEEQGELYPLVIETIEHVTGLMNQ